MGYVEHETKAATQGPVPVGVITVSDTRTPETDTSGATIRQLLVEAGHTVVHYQLIKDEPEQIDAVLNTVCAPDAPARIVLFNGGTGIAPRDTTFDALSRRLEKTLPGFGELFRAISYQQIGAAAMLSRATAGVYHGRVIFSMPGSTNAVRTAMTELILPQLKHLAWEVMRKT